MESKLRYIANHLNKIQHKEFELYALSRLWNLLDDDSIKFVFQQCMYLTEDKTQRALADLYLPQFNMIIEVDEAHHLNTIEADEKRSKGIRDVVDKNIIIKRIPFAEKIGGKIVALPDERIKESINDIVETIRQAKQHQIEQGIFEPWACGYDKTADYYINKGSMYVEDGDAMNKFNDVLQLDKKYRGYVEHYSGYKAVSTADNCFFWSPSLSNRNWKNILSPDGLYLSEERLTDIIDDDTHEIKQTAEEKNMQLINDDLCNPDQKRITFVREKTMLGSVQLRFAGIFVIDKTQTELHNHPMWRRIENRLELNHNGDFSYLNKL